MSKLLTVRHSPDWMSSICLWARFRLDDYAVYVSALFDGPLEIIVVNEVSELSKLCWYAVVELLCPVSEVDASKLSRAVRPQP
jgi:hypothetical protein